MTLHKIYYQPDSAVNTIEEKQWVRKIREESDREAFEQMFRNYYKRLHGFAYSYVSSREKAEDIVQSVFLRIWMNRESFDPPGKVKNYLFSAIKNEALNMLKHQQVKFDSEKEIAELFIHLQSSTYEEDNPELENLKNAIQQEIERLPARCKEIYLLNRRSGLTYTEISDHLGISINTVGTQMGRALKALRENLSDYLPIIVTSGLLL
jgi:RNA polymerase sigma-70 factor, ECF subfamily